jgi:hypothetical protein
MSTNEEIHKSTINESDKQWKKMQDRIVLNPTPLDSDFSFEIGFHSSFVHQFATFAFLETPEAATPDYSVAKCFASEPTIAVFGLSDQLNVTRMAQ